MQIEDITVFDTLDDTDGNVDDGRVFSIDEEPVVGEGYDAVWRPAEVLGVLAAKEWKRHLDAFFVEPGLLFWVEFTDPDVLQAVLFCTAIGRRLYRIEKLDEISNIKWLTFI